MKKLTKIQKLSIVSASLALPAIALLVTANIIISKKIIDPIKGVGTSGDNPIPIIIGTPIDNPIIENIKKKITPKNSYKDLLKEAQTKYFDVIDKTIDANIQKGNLRFNTKDEYYLYPYGELIDSSLYPFKERQVSHRKSIFTSVEELTKRLVKTETTKINKSGINSWGYYDEDFFKKNILIRIAHDDDYKYIKSTFNKNRNVLENTFIYLDQRKRNQNIYEMWKDYQKDEDGPRNYYPANVRTRIKKSVFITIKKSDLNSSKLENIFLGNPYDLGSISINTKSGMWNFLKEERKAGKF